jgi:two-component system cell cycle sensor histidine kinase/response regulator CckA
VREVTARILREEGYRVIEAGDGESALQAAAVHGDGIDLLLTDVIMPRMGGKELAERVRAARPGIRVIFSSGYDEEAVARGLGRDARSLQKPVSPDALLHAVRDALDAPS